MTTPRKFRAGQPCDYGGCNAPQSECSGDEPKPLRRAVWFFLGYMAFVAFVIFTLFVTRN